jgi:hypothetical protein
MHHVFESNHLLWRAWDRTAWLGVTYYTDSPYWERRMRAILPHYENLLRQGAGMHHYLLMADYQGGSTGCVTRIEAQPSTPQLRPWQWIAQITVQAVAPAKVREVKTHCAQSVFSSQP